MLDKKQSSYKIFTEGRIFIFMKYRHNKFLRFLLLLAITVGMFQISAVTAQAATSVTTLDDLKSAFSNGGDYQLGAHITTTGTLETGANMTAMSLDLNGYGILMTGNGSVIKCNANLPKELTIYDSRPDATNYIVISSDRRAISVSSTKQDGAVKVSGGYIAGGKSDQGGGVYIGGNVNGSSTFTMNGGNIIGNTASDKGGGVYANGIFIMSGGNIINNTAGSSGIGGGVYVQYSSTQKPFIISGSPTITDNSHGKIQDDVTLAEEMKINLSEGATLDDSAKIGVRLTSTTYGTVFTDGFSGKFNVSSFFSDNSREYVVSLNTEGEAMLVNHKHEFGNFRTSGDSTIVVTCTVEADCDLPDHTATLTIGAPVDDTGVATLTCDPEYLASKYFFIEDLIPEIKYSTKQSDGTYGEYDTTPRTADGFYKAKVTYEYFSTTIDASVTYGLNCIQYPETDPEHGSVTGPGGKRKTGATVGAVIEPVISPDLGYEIDTLTVVREDNEPVTVTDNKSFIMPDVNVTVNATFKLADYKITYKNIEHGTISGYATANYSQDVELIISPDIGYELVVISVDQESNNDKVTVTNNKFTMPASNVIVNAAFKLTDYAITYSADSHGTISGDATANYSKDVELIISPDLGYAIDTLSVVRNDNNQNVSVTNNQSFVMPPAGVTVNASFKQIDYEISGNITSGSITVPDTAHYGDKIRFVITPDDGYGISTISIPGVNFNLISRDTDTGVEIYELTMPHDGISIDVELGTLTIYTVFYKAADGLTSLRYRFYDAGNGFEMRSDAKAGDVACWAGQAKGAVGREKFPISFKVNDGEWGALTEYNVVNDVSSINSLPEGSAILIAGDDNAFIASFTWGAFDINSNGEIYARDDGGVKDYFVSNTTTSISVPNPTKTSYDFAGWSYTDDNKKIQTIEPGSVNTTVSIKDNITCTTIFSAIWQPESPKIFFDLNGGRTNYNTVQSVQYGGKASRPADPIKSGYALDYWEVKYDVKAQSENGTEMMLASKSRFDFDKTKIIENMTLKAVWKHAHDYAYLTLANAVARAPGIFTQNDVNKYNSHLHFRICLDTRCLEHGTEPHEFDKNGKCYYCGFEDPSQAAVTVEVTINSRDAVPANTYKTKMSSYIVLIAPTRGTDKFIKWEYRSLDGTEWKDLSSSASTVSPITGNVRINAVYERLTNPELTLSAQHYEDDGILFMLNYTLPTGSTAKNAVVIYGDNYMLGYKTVERETFPLDRPELSKGLGTLTKIFGAVGEVTDFVMDTLGIEDEAARSMIHFYVGLATGEGVADMIGPVVNLGLEAAGLDDTMAADAINFGISAATGDAAGAAEAACSAAKKYVDDHNNGKSIVEISYKGREDNFLTSGGDTKSLLMLKMMLGQGVTVPGNNYAKKHTAKKEDLGQLIGRSYGAYTGIKDVLNGERFFYVMGYVEYSVPGSTTNKIAVVGPIAVTYNGTNNPVTDSVIQVFE